MAILRFGFGIHEESSVLLDMIIFNVMFGPLTLGGFLGFAGVTSLMFFVYRWAFSAKAQFGCAVIAAFLNCLCTQSGYRHVISNYLRWFGFTVVSGDMDTFDDFRPRHWLSFRNVGIIYSSWFRVDYSVLEAT